MRLPGKLDVGETMVAGPRTGTTYTFGQVTLAVEGPIETRDAVFVRAPGALWPDYVFRPEYKLQPLPEVARFIAQNGHLPDVPSAADVQRDGLELASMNATLLRKVEELTLHLIALQQANERLTERMSALEVQRTPGCRRERVARAAQPLITI